MDIVALHNLEYPVSNENAPLVNFVLRHTVRGGCQCGTCADKRSTPDIFPTPVLDLTLFKVAAVGDPDRDTFIRLSRAHVGVFNVVDVFDGKEHGFQELGAWIGDQSLAFRYMALGAALKVFMLYSPETMLPSDTPTDLKVQLARAGYVTVLYKP